MRTMLLITALMLTIPAAAQDGQADNAGLLTWPQESAAGGDAGAQFMLGEAYAWGRNIPARRALSGRRTRTARASSATTSRR